MHPRRFVSIQPPGYHAKLSVGCNQLANTLKDDSGVEAEIARRLIEDKSTSLRPGFQIEHAYAASRAQQQDAFLLQSSRPNASHAA